MNQTNNEKQLEMRGARASCALPYPCPDFDNHSFSCFRSSLQFSSSSVPISFASSSIAVRYSCRSLSTIRSQRRSSSDHYQKNAVKYWDSFYKRHDNKFFKDRHYLEKDWRRYFSQESSIASPVPKILLEVGCGAGNTIFPLIDAFPNIFVHACDFSSNAIALVKSHGGYRDERMNAFVCDVTNDDLCQKLIPASVDVVTLIFMLSAVSPKKMPLILQNIKRVLKPNGYILLRDYAMGDFAQEKLADRKQMISENFYVRGDGTLAFYFSEDCLSTLFKRVGFETVEIDIYCKRIENRLRNISMDRHWIRAVFSNSIKFES